MAISFTQVPSRARVPFVYVEIDDSRNASSERPFRSLLVGQRLATGEVAEKAPTLISSAAEAVRAFGRGSMLAAMAAAFRRQNRLGELWAVALDDKSGGTAKLATIKVDTASTAGGTFYVWIAGRRIAVTLSGSTPPNNIAAAIHAAVVAVQADLPVTTTYAADTVTFTARHKGLSAGHEIDVRLNYGSGAKLPAGMTATVTPNSVAGTSDPDTGGAFDVLSDERFDVIAWPYYPDAEMDRLEAQLDANWTASAQLDGIGLTAFRGTAAEATTYGNLRSSRWSSAMAISDSPTPAYEWAAALAGAVAASAEIDPALPFQTLPLAGVMPPSDAKRFTFTERATLLTDGMATHNLDAAGQVRIERMIATEQTNEAWLDINAPLTLSYLRSNFRGRLQSKFARFKLADTGTRFKPGQKVVTPKVARDEAVAWFGEMEERALVEGFDAFRDGLIVERNAGDRDRLDFMLPTDIINQLRVVGAQLSFLD